MNTNINLKLSIYSTFVRTMSSSLSTHSRPSMKKSSSSHKTRMDRAVHACTLDGSLFSSSQSLTARQFLDEIRPVLDHSSGKFSQYYILVDRHGIRVPDNGVLKPGMNGLRVRYTILVQSCVPILQCAFEEYQASVHFFNPDTACVHDLFPKAFRKYEKHYHVNPPPCDEDLPDEENNSCLHFYQESVAKFEKAMMDLNPLSQGSSDFDKKVEHAWDLFVDMYEWFHSCDWSRLQQFL